MKSSKKYDIARPDPVALAENPKTNLRNLRNHRRRMMAFVNEYVSEEDVKKYGLEEINRQYRKTNVSGHYSWTADRKRDIYLREVQSGREEYADQHGFTLYWKGLLIFVELKRKGGGVRGGKGWTAWTLLFLGLPEELQEKRPEIIADLKEALTAYKDFGVYSATTEHTATFEF